MQPFRHTGLVQLRTRNESDLDACTELIRLIHERDGWPPHWPEDLRRFITPPEELAAWVAEDRASLSGHIALHSSGSVAMMEAACRATALLSSQLAVIARLFVAPSARRTGVGRALLATAAADAHDRNCVPVLEVTPALESAVNLYESCGWTRVDQVQARFGDGSSLPVYVYVGPSPRPDGTTSS